MRLRGQHVPEAPCEAHGQLSFVFSAPVCLFPSCRPQDSLQILCAVSSASLGQRNSRGRPLSWMKWEAVLLVMIIAPLRALCQVVVKKLQAESDFLRNKALSAWHSAFGRIGELPIAKC